MRDDELLEPILDEDDDGGPAAEPAAPAAARGRRRAGARRGPAIVAAVGLLCGSVGGLAGWRLGGSADGDPGAVRVADGSVAGSATSTTPAPAPSPAFTPMSPTVGGAYSGSDGHAYIEVQAVELIDRRVTEDGLTIRTSWPVDDGCYPGGWCPPPECRGGPSVLLGLSTDRMVGTGGGYRQPEVVAPPMYIGGWSVVGQSEGDPVLWVTAMVPEDAVVAELVIDGDRRDRADVHRRWAGLAVRHELEMATMASDHDAGSTYEVPDVAGIEVVARDEGGRVVGREALASLHPPDGTEHLPARCEPPAPPLAPPGEQPADPEAARAAVRAIYAQAWNHTSTRGQKLAAIHDTRGVEAAMERAAASYGGAVGTTVVEVGDIVFISPEQAQLHFRLNYEGAPSLGNRLGTAVLVDGRWLVTRSSYCEILSVAGAACGSS